jgi:hypothetical protein
MRLKQAWPAPDDDRRARRHVGESLLTALTALLTRATAGQSSGTRVDPGSRDQGLFDIPLPRISIVAWERPRLSRRAA